MSETPVSDILDLGSSKLGFGDREKVSWGTNDNLNPDNEIGLCA